MDILPEKRIFPPGEEVWTKAVGRRDFLKGLAAGGAAVGFVGLVPGGARAAENGRGGSALDGVIDLHIHPAPDITKRKYDDISLAQDARAHGARAVVLKCHVAPTAGRAWIAEKMVPGIRVFGGVALNEAVGGLNPTAVEVSVKMGGKLVWLPTVDSSHEYRRRRKNGGVETVIDGRVVPELTEVLKLVAKHDLIFGTGHLAPAETIVVVEEAKRLGVKKIVVNHPETVAVNMSIEDQKRLADYGVVFERVYSRVLPDGSWEKSLERNLRAIEQVGYESTILATDGGQTVNPIWSQAWLEYLEYFYAQGVPDSVIRHMTRELPAKLLNI